MSALCPTCPLLLTDGSFLGDEFIRVYPFRDQHRGSRLIQCILTSIRSGALLFPSSSTDCIYTLFLIWPNIFRAPPERIWIIKPSEPLCSLDSLLCLLWLQWCILIQGGGGGSQMTDVKEEEGGGDRVGMRQWFVKMGSRATASYTKQIKQPACPS